jgi:hypothetical protein
MKKTLIAILVAVICLFVCGNAFAQVASEVYPVVHIAVSEYISWSTFIVAGNVKNRSGKPLINPKEGAPYGSIEDEYKIDYVVDETDYGSCITNYVSGKADAVCITNVDVLGPCLSVRSVSLAPTSTSYGADKCLVEPSIKNMKDLRGVPVYGLGKSVSELLQYCGALHFGEDPGQHVFMNMDPGDASLALQNGTIRACNVWNPIALQTMASRKDVVEFFNSTIIPGHIVDMIVMSQKTLDKPYGSRAACGLLSVQYTICRQLANPRLQDAMLLALSKKFSNLDLAQMNIAARNCRFYSTPAQGIHLFDSCGPAFPWKKEVKDTSDLFSNKGFNPNSTEVTTKTFREIMDIVVPICDKIGMISPLPDVTVESERVTIGYGTREQAPDVRLRFDTSYMKEVLPKFK